MSVTRIIQIKKGLFTALFQPVNNSPLIIFRILFGFLLCYHFTAAIFNGTVYHGFIEPPFTFTYIGFEFLQPLPGNGMYIYFGVMAVLGLMIMLGAWYRASTLLLALMWTIVYLMQKSGYNNHYYLMLLLCWIMTIMPANRYFSIDVKRNTVTPSGQCYRYCIWIFIAQLAIVYFYAAISKLTSDWLSGKFIAIQFSRFSSRQVVGIIYQQKWFQLFICYGGFLFDLLIVPLLLWKRTRNYAFVASCLFHLFNSYTFQIGIFPYLSIALNIFFLDADFLSRFFFRSRHAAPDLVLVNTRLQKLIIQYALLFYLFFQVVVPLRSWFFPGNVYWTEEGYRMSWKMMLRTKSGQVYFKVVDPVSLNTWKVLPGESFSASHMMWMANSPDIIWQYAQRLSKDFKNKGYPKAEVYAIGTVSLNRSLPKPMIDSTVNLAAERWKPFRHSKWITDFSR